MANESAKYPFKFCRGLGCQLPHILNAITMAQAKENAAVQNATDSNSVEESDKFYAEAKKLKTSTAGAERMLTDFNRIPKPAICDQCPL